MQNNHGALLQKPNKQVNSKFLQVSWLVRLGGVILLAFVFFSNAAATQAQSKNHTVYLPIIMHHNPAPPDCLPSAEQWLCLFNQYRSAAGLSTLASNGTMSSDLALHTHYMLLNPEQESFHDEYPNEPGYTVLGETAGHQSNMAKKAGTSLGVKESLELWIGFPSHRYGMLHPDLTSSGFDLSCDLTNCFSGLNVLGSLPSSYLITSQNVVYPGDGQTGIPAVAFPVSWSFYMPWVGEEDDSDEVVLISGEIYDQNNQKLSVTWWQPNHDDDSWDYRNQVGLTPSQPLLSLHTYRVEMTVQFHGQTLQKSWHFTTR